MWLHLIALGWLYVTLMMAVAEGLSPQGTWLGALFTLLLYGLLPLGLLLYILGTPLRKRRLRRQASEAAAAEAADEAATVTAAPADGLAGQGDHRGHAAGDPLAAKRKEV